MNYPQFKREIEKATQVSIAELPEDQQAAAMHATELASEQYPSVLVAGHLLHVFKMRGEWEVWLNCEDADFTGLCLSAAETRDEAVAAAVAALEAALEALQSPAPGTIA